MPNAIEELLIKIGIDVDSSGLKEVEGIQDRVGKSAKRAAKGMNQSSKALKGNVDFLRRGAIQRDRNQKQEKYQEELDKKNQRGLEKRLGLINKFGIAAGAAGAVAAKGFMDYTKRLADVGSENAKVAREVGISSEVLQAAIKAGGIEGISPAEMTGAFQSLNSTLGQLKIGQGPQTAMNMLQLSAFNANGELKNSLELFNDLISASESLSPQDRAQRLGAMGVPQLGRIGGGGRFKWDEELARQTAIAFESKETLTAAENLGDATQNAGSSLDEWTEELRRNTMQQTEFGLGVAGKALGSETGKKLSPKNIPEVLSGATYFQGLIVRGIAERMGLGEKSVNIESTINVNGATDPEAVGKAAAKANKEQLESVLRNKEGSAQ